MAYSKHKQPVDAITVHETAVKYNVSEDNEYAMAQNAQAGLKVSAFFDLTAISGLTNQELSSILDLSFKQFSDIKRKRKHLMRSIASSF